MQEKRGRLLRAAVRFVCELLARLTAATQGEWVLEVKLENGNYVHLRRHNGPIRSEADYVSLAGEVEDLEALARSVGLLADS